MKLTFKDFLGESINDKGILKAVFVVGIPGAGKSYTVKELKGSISPRIVNTDRATEFLAKTKNLMASSKTWPVMRDSAHRITENALLNYLNGLLPLFIDGTSSNASSILQRAGILESLGYDVGMVFIDTPLDTALDRAAARERKVDPEFIKQVHADSEANKKFFSSKFEFFKEVKNGHGELNDEALLEAYRKVSGFFTSPLLNPVGARTLEKLKAAKQGYLMPTILDKEELQKKISIWYRK